MWTERSGKRVKFSRSMERSSSAPLPLTQVKGMHKSTQNSPVPSTINKTVSQHFKNRSLCHATYTYATQCVRGWIAPSFKFERAWSYLTGAEYIFLVSGEQNSAEHFGGEANTSVSEERKFLPLSSVHMLWFKYIMWGTSALGRLCNLLITCQWCIPKFRAVSILLKCNNIFRYRFETLSSY